MATASGYDPAGTTSLYFETDAGDGFREPGFTTQRRLEPQITIGLLTDQSGFPLMVEAFEGNKAETLTMLPTIRAFMAAHDLPDVTVVDPCSREGLRSPRSSSERPETRLPASD